jgi:hypothetical protein
VASEESFSRVLRGYDPTEVDPLVQKLRRELLSAKTLHDETAAQLKELEARYAELELELDVKRAPTAAGLNVKLNNKLKKADSLAAEIVRRAESDALLIRSAAEKTSSQFIEAAKEGFEQARTEAQELARTIEAQAFERAEQIVADAEKTAAEILETGREDAQRLRGEASTIAANLRAESRNDVARYMAEAQREIEELKLVLTTNRDRKIAVNEKVMRILKLNADGAAVREDMERELQARHQESVMQTEKYIGAAEAQLATARTRMRELEAEMQALPANAAIEAENLLEQARVAARDEISSAERLAKKKVADAEKYVAAVLSSIYSQLEGIRVEREAVAEFFDALRLELQHTLGDAVTPKKLES